MLSDWSPKKSPLRLLIVTEENSDMMRQLTIIASACGIQHPEFLHSLGGVDGVIGPQCKFDLALVCQDFDTRSRSPKCHLQGIQMVALMRKYNPALPIIFLQMSGQQAVFCAWALNAGATEVLLDDEWRNDRGDFTQLARSLDKRSWALSLPPPKVS